MNNGMTQKKLNILRYKLNLNEYSRREGQVSNAIALTMTMILTRDIRIFEGKETAYLQG